MSRSLKTVLALLALSLLSTSASAERRIVVFQPGTSGPDRLAIAARVGGRIVRTLDFIDAVVVEVPPHRVTVLDTRLRSETRVARVEPDPRINWLKDAAPSFAQAPFADIHFSRFKHAGPDLARMGSGSQTIPWGVRRVDAPEAWPKSRGQGVKVCVIDTGIDYRHPDLKANVKGGWNVLDKSADFADDNGHGTHVAGTIAALDNAIGVVGVAPEAELYGVKVLASDGSGTFDDVIAGMQWAVQHRMQVVSMSLAADQGLESLRLAVAAMAKAGIVLVAAAGNSGSDVEYPAAYPGAIAVAAMDSSNHAAYFSSRGPQVAFIAPGVDVESTYLGGGYQRLDGTSMAAPHVSGLAALAIAARGYTDAPDVLQALERAAEPLPGVLRDAQGAGVIDAAKLVR